MTDTAPDADAAFTELFRARSGSDRVRMACEMFDDAKALIAAEIRSRDPHISPTELRVKIFERLYLNDFDPAVVSRITTALRRP